ncbi:hypothetical protein HYR54_12905 [Candidatus Acetothermia bacterium]|nr:hypothetical protein [Candidatus Acetothermia bacterium]
MRKALVRGTCDPDLAKEAKEVAQSRGVTFSGLLERALDSYLQVLITRDRQRRERVDEREEIQ